MDSIQAALGGVFDTDQHDPAIQGASAVTGLPQEAPSPSAEPPWLLKDLTETIASFLCPVDALALDASGTATRCVVVEERTHIRDNWSSYVSEHRAHRLAVVPLGGARTRLHTVGIPFLWRDQGWGIARAKYGSFANATVRRTILRY